MIGNRWLLTWETSRLIVVATESTSLVTALSETALRAHVVVLLLELKLKREDEALLAAS